MIIKLDMQSRVPIYEQLKVQIGEMILSGQLSEDDQLPSVRVLARDLGVNPNTVQKAYQDLEREQIIYSVAGRGSYISPGADVGRQLRERQLGKIRQVVLQARKCGIQKERILECVDKIYEEGNP